MRMWGQGICNFTGGEIRLAELTPIEIPATVEFAQVQLQPSLELHSEFRTALIRISDRTYLDF